MIFLWIIAGAALAVSLAVDGRKTRLAVIKGLKMLMAVAPLMLGVLAAVSLALAAVSPEMLKQVLAGGGPLPFLAALVIGSIALIPGYVAYPLAGILRQNGASIGVLAAFITTLMMVGVLTLPLEARFFGWRVAWIRNALALGGALVVALGMTLVLT